MTDGSQRTLYGLLAEQARQDAEPGETLTTKAKETLDNDVEALALLEVKYDLRG
jgi:hypothetical protein